MDEDDVDDFAEDEEILAAQLADEVGLLLIFRLCKSI